MNPKVYLWSYRQILQIYTEREKTSVQHYFGYLPLLCRWGCEWFIYSEVSVCSQFYCCTYYGGFEWFVHIHIQTHRHSNTHFGSFETKVSFRSFMLWYVFLIHDMILKIPNFSPQKFVVYIDLWKRKLLFIKHEAKVKILHNIQIDMCNTELIVFSLEYEIQMIHAYNKNCKHFVLITQWSLYPKI